MTDKLYTQSDLEALRERCAKVVERIHYSVMNPTEAAKIIRALPLTPQTEEGTK